MNRSPWCYIPSFVEIGPPVPVKKIFEGFSPYPTNFQVTGCNSFWKIRVIIWANYDGLESPMLHTKFHGNRSAGSGEEEFWRVFTIYGCGGNLGQVTQMRWTNFRSPFPRRLHIKFGFDRPRGFGEEDVWKCGRTTTTDAGPLVYYKLTNEPSAQVS